MEKSIRKQIAEKIPKDLASFLMKNNAYFPFLNEMIKWKKEVNSNKVFFRKSHLLQDTFNWNKTKREEKYWKNLYYSFWVLMDARKTDELEEGIHF